MLKSEEKYRDIIFVLDVSGSMSEGKLDKVKSDSTELINNLLTAPMNKAALITFETSAELILPLTNNKDELLTSINNLETGNTTNYFQPLVYVDTILKDYKKEENREWIVLFLTDGYPNEDVPNQIAQYKYLKSQYPYIKINGIQYEMGTEVLDPIKEVSDNQFIADMVNLNNVLFEASVVAINYENFEIVDYIDDTYFEIESIEDINPSKGTVKLEYENDTPKITWNIEYLSTGKGSKLTIDLKLKEKYIQEGGLFPTNKKEEMKTEIEKITEDITSTKTPILSDDYNVIYEGNAPSGCTVSNVPEKKHQVVLSTVEISDTIPICEGYKFKKWEIVTENVEKTTIDSFIMPEKDVTLRATWSKLNVAKSIDGKIYARSKL